MKEFGKKLEIALKWKGMTKTKLAEILKVHKTTISDWTKGKANPTLEKFYRICLILDETPNYFLGFEN